MDLYLFQKAVALMRQVLNPLIMIPLLILAALAVVLGLLPGTLTEYISGIVAGLL